MALFKPGSLVTDLSGSIGGQTFGRNRGGMYVRNRTIPVNPNSPGQNQIRTIFANLIFAWTNTLTPVQRVAWDDYAAGVTLKNRLGENITPTGQNMFVRSNTPLQQAGLAAIIVAPVILTLGDPADFTLSVNIGGPTLDITAIGPQFDLNLDDDTMLFYEGRPQTLATNFFKGPYRFLGSIVGDAIAPPALPIQFTPVFTAGLNQRHFVRAFHIHPDARMSYDVQTSDDS